MIEPLPWDSAHFGFPIARWHGPPTAEGVAEADGAGVRCLYLLADASDAALIERAERHGFRIVDVRQTLARPVGPDVPGPPESIRPGAASDLEFLEAIAAEAHRDSRFFTDSRFDPAAAAELYRRWLRASVLENYADLVDVAEIDGRPVGYITGTASADNGALSIGLLAVAPAARRRGAGRALIDAVLASAAERGLGTVDVVTQGRNAAAQGLYQAAGFGLRQTQVWLHRWGG